MQTSTDADKSIHVEEYYWVGIVYPRDQKQHITFITPLTYYDRNDSVWHLLSERDRWRHFPNNGKVVRFISEFPQAKIGRLISFYADSNRKIAAQEEHDPKTSLYLTSNDPEVAPFAQLLDWNARIGELFEIPTLLEQGINAESCLSHQIYIGYRGFLYGPITLEPERSNPQLLKPREYLLGSSTDGQPLFATQYPFDSKATITLENHLFVDPPAIGSALRHIDLSLPQVVMRKALRASNSIASPDLVNAVHLSKQKITDLATFSNSHGPEALHIEESTLARAKHIIQQQTNSLDGLQELLEELSDNHPLLQKARLLEVEQRKDEIEQEALRLSAIEHDRLQAVQEQVQAKTHQLQTVQEQIQAIEDTLSKRKEENAQADQKYERMLDEFDALEDSMQQRLAQLRKEPLQLLADLQLLTALPSSLLLPSSSVVTGPHENFSHAASHAHPHFFTDAYTQDLSIPAETLHSLPWVEAAKGGYATSDDAKICAAALLAGLLPAPEGPTAADTWQAVAQIVAGGRLWSIPVPLTALSPLDLFGTLTPHLHSFLPAAGDFADILLEAFTHPTQLAIVLLEGVDRVPLSPVLAPLLQLYRRTRQNIQQGKTQAYHAPCLNLFHPHALAANDPYQKLSSFVWPENLLLGATFDNEASSLPLPQAYTSWFVRIPVKGKQSSPLSSPKDWQVAPDQWYQREKALFTSTSNNDSESWPEHFDRWQRQFCVAMGDLKIKKEKRENLLKLLWPE